MKALQLKNRSRVTRRVREAQRDVALSKFRRIMELMILLMNGRHTVKHLAERLDCSGRTVTRYLKVMEEVGIPVELDSHFQYFIASDNCPLCGKEVNHGH